MDLKYLLRNVNNLPNTISLKRNDSKSGSRTGGKLFLQMEF